MYIHLLNDWPQFRWKDDTIVAPLAEVRHLQGKLMGKMSAIGFKLQNEAILDTLTLDVLKTNEIEGEILDTEQVRSSIARQLGFEISTEKQPSRYIDGMVELMLDATQNYNSRLTKERLCNWHAALIPTGRSGMYTITVGDWRKDYKGPMQVVSGAMGKEKVHFEAPHAERVANEMTYFLSWFNGQVEIEPVLKAAISHLWFITIHPFDDGNGRIARTITDLQLARSDNSPLRFYSMSNQILKERKAYYQILEKTQKGHLDITNWLLWFFDCLKKSIKASDEILGMVIAKATFWEKHHGTRLNKRQHKMINKLFDGFIGKLTTSKWAKICKCSRDTALRDIQDLEKKGILHKDARGGRSTSYSLNLS